MSTFPQFPYEPPPEELEAKVEMFVRNPEARRRMFTNTARLWCTNHGVQTPEQAAAMAYGGILALLELWPDRLGDTTKHKRILQVQRLMDAVWGEPAPPA